VAATHSEASTHYLASKMHGQQIALTIRTYISHSYMA
jgi:hypothetical protein